MKRSPPERRVLALLRLPPLLWFQFLHQFKLHRLNNLLCNPQLAKRAFTKNRV
jgi:hypothetical protein